jgi:hypothetical protein
VEEKLKIKHILTELENPYNRLTFLFLDFVLDKITDFNLLFQSNEGLIGSRYPSLIILYKTLV